MTEAQRNAVTRAAESGALTLQQVADAMGLDVAEVERVFGEVAERRAPPKAAVPVSASRGPCRDAVVAQRALAAKTDACVSSDSPRALAETQLPRLTFDDHLRRRLGRRSWRSRFGR